MDLDGNNKVQDLQTTVEHPGTGSTLWMTSQVLLDNSQGWVTFRSTQVLEHFVQGVGFVLIVGLGGGTVHGADTNVINGQTESSQGTTDWRDTWVGSVEEVTVVFLSLSNLLLGFFLDFLDTFVEEGFLFLCWETFNKEEPCFKSPWCSLAVVKIPLPGAGTDLPILSVAVAVKPKIPGHGVDERFLQNIVLDWLVLVTVLEHTSQGGNTTHTGTRTVTQLGDVDVLVQFVWVLDTGRDEGFDGGNQDKQGDWVDLGDGVFGDTVTLGIPTSWNLTSNQTVESQGLWNVQNSTLQQLDGVFTGLGVFLDLNLVTVFVLEVFGVVQDLLLVLGLDVLVFDWDLGLGINPTGVVSTLQVTVVVLDQTHNPGNFDTTFKGEFTVGFHFPSGSSRTPWTNFGETVQTVGTEDTVVWRHWQDTLSWSGFDTSGSLLVLDFTEDSQQVGQHDSVSEFRLGVDLV
ncbi:hypothetical protein WICPIJ_009265 [Wickerhamomyces pijperi]|uniref:Uncharacterized protein n=1 Tax=Wickerhamomyces pijperi TaxID=599730 RepID=A0A9P8PPC9_WICPI|nr:hypothetical protein WICPIJ_009265 [Wickerhamomyces pijperi]